ncbi:putative serpin A13 isoform X3 [Phyllostomus hastatus]|uniref:putative serpin A13 isoform X3 n=1 Tax=Phyllostomus hastatus TaxID=9423 RepID=UPI001E684B4C|nr:putative serpin A13 isoform X3 [Phyllostomus hastatus]
MGAPPWWLLVPALVAVGRCLAPAGQEDSDPVHADPGDVPPRPALPCHKLSVSNIDFAFNLYRQLALTSPRENILFSPASISSALAALFLGAPAASRAQLLEGLGLNLTVVPEAEIQEAFQDLLLRLPARDPRLLLTVGQRSFHSLGPGAGRDPAEAQKCIQEYVEKQTQGKLGAWVEELGNETAAVLVNHVLLRAGWARPFAPQATRPKEFFVDEHRTVPVPMMWQKARHRFLHDPELQCTVLQMDHAGDAATFFVFPQRGALGRLEDALLPETLIKWDSLLRTRELDFHFPKFSISSTSRLELLLPREPVGGGPPGQPGLNISRVTHKAVMVLDEEGAEAAAATSIQLTPGPHPDLDPTPAPDTGFHRPFLVMTFHMETGSLLFLGKSRYRRAGPTPVTALGQRASRKHHEDRRPGSVSNVMSPTEASSSAAWKRGVPARTRFLVRMGNGAPANGMGPWGQINLNLKNKKM